MLNTSPDAWELATLSLENLAWNRNPRYLSVVVLGKDSRFWQGLYGSKVAQISLRVLGSPDQVSYWMKETDSVPERRGTLARRFLRQNHPDGGGEENATNRRGVAVNEAIDRDARPGLYGKLLWDGFVPLACFFVLAWLLGS